MAWSEEGYSAEAVGAGQDEERQRKGLEEDAGASEDELDWARIKAFLQDNDERKQLLLEVFEATYGISEPSEALLKVKNFLGHFMVKDFDYKGFHRVLGTLPEDAEDDEEAWKSFEDDELNADVSAACRLMLRMAVAIAKAYSLRKQEWEDVNNACGNAIRSLPSCYRLQRKLPGAFNDARALRILDREGHADNLEHASLNPWNSDEGRLLFEQHHGVAWSDVEALTANDGPASDAFVGKFSVLQIVKMPALCIVHLQTLSLEDSSGTMRLSEGDVLLWEVDGGLGCLLEPGFTLDGCWRLLGRDACFMTSLERVSPSWAPADLQDEEEGEAADSNAEAADMTAAEVKQPIDDDDILL